MCNDAHHGSTRHALLRYLSYAKPYRWAVIVVVLAGIAKFTLPLIAPWLTGRLIDDVALNVEGRSLDARYTILMWLGLGLAGTALAEGIAIFIRGYYTTRVVTGVTFDLRRSLWRHLQRLSLDFHHSRPTGTLLSRLMSDISVSQQMMNAGIINVFIDAAAGIAALTVLLLISWKLTLIVVAILPLYGVLYRKLNPRLRQASHDVQEQTSVMSGEAVERLSGMAVVQSFAQEKAEQQRFDEQAHELRGRTVRRGRLNHTLNALSNAMVALAAAGVWIYGIHMILNGTLTPGRLVQFTGTAGALYLPIRRFSQINIMFQMSMAAIERVFAIFDNVPEVRQSPDAIRKQPEQGRVEFEDVRFRYQEEGPDVLKGMSFIVEPGQRVAIVGESGAGKSTLAMLIPRLFDVTGGAIRIDDVDLRDYHLKTLRRSIGIVLQESILFSGSIYENLRYGRKDATWDEIVAAARMANAHNFIMEMDNGYNTEIGERGASLSGGQKQRISIARTILQDPRILIFDEATSALDSESENLITEAMEHVMEGRTSLVIAHRLSTIMGADMILALRDGKLVEHGPHTELLKKGGYYRFLFEQQFGPLQELLESTREQVGEN